MRTRLLFMLTTLASLASLSVAAADSLFVIDQAHIVISNARSIPSGDAAWQVVDLPDNWHVTQPGFKGVAWYRLRFSLQPESDRSYALSLPSARSKSLEFHLNGQLLVRTREGATPPGSGSFTAPVIQIIPAAMLKAGENVLHVRATGNAQARAGLSRITIGDAAAVNAAIEPRVLMARMTQMFAATVGLAGFLALALWGIRRNDATLGWFAAAALGWATLATIQILTRWVDLGPMRHVLYYLLNQCLGAIILILGLRIIGRRVRFLEYGVLALYLAGIPLMYFFDRTWVTEVRFAYNVLNAILLTILLALVVAARERPRPILHVVLATAILFALLISVQDYLRWWGILDIEGPKLLFLQLPGLLLVFSALIVERHIKMVRATERINIDLERRVAAKTREIELQHERLRDAEREQAVTHERGRILADMHDGLGASLVVLKRILQSGKASITELESRVEDSLLEMRMAIDALAPVDGDLAVVLGGVRQRFQSALEQAGIKLSWRVAHLPPMANLNPTRVLAVQRILAEAFANILKHSGARAIVLTATFDADSKQVCISVEDDGSGISGGQDGRGIGNMQRRAAELGGTLKIEPGANAGTRLQLVLPVELEAE